MRRCGLCVIECVFALELVLAITFKATTFKLYGVGASILALASGLTMCGEVHQFALRDRRPVFTLIIQCRTGDTGCLRGGVTRPPGVGVGAFITQSLVDLILPINSLCTVAARIGCVASY